MEDYELSLDPTRIQIDVVHAQLAASYWSPGIRREVLETAIRNSLVVGAYEKTAGRQVGFARAVTDFATFAWLCDVVVDEAHRRRAIAKRMISALMADPRVQTLRRWCLATRDAHALYRALGFSPVPGERWMELLPPSAAWQKAYFTSMAPERASTRACGHCERERRASSASPVSTSNARTVPVAPTNSARIAVKYPRPAPT
jgi:N-acetylglutamate synthase-like GNAT family acetyltransferase